MAVATVGAGSTSTTGKSASISWARANSASASTRGGAWAATEQIERLLFQPPASGRGLSLENELDVAQIRQRLAIERIAGRIAVDDQKAGGLHKRRGTLGIAAHARWPDGIRT